MSRSGKTWPEVVEQIFEGFRAQRDVTPDWLQLLGTGRQPRVDILYPELDVAIWFNDSVEAPFRDGVARGSMGAVVHHGVQGTLLVIDGDLNASSPTWAEIQTALSASARRISQQQGTKEAKLHLLPRIAAAKTRCQRICDGMLSPARGYGRGRPQRRRQALAAWPHQVDRAWAMVQSRLATLRFALSPILAVLKRVALLLAVLLAVNAASYLVANFLDLRGPMAYNYVPDNKVPLADVVASYPEYLLNVLQGDFGTMRQNELRGMLFSNQEIPILELVFQRLPRSLALLGVAILFAIVVGIAAGFLSVNYKTHQTNPLALILSLAGFSMPGFYLAILILYLMIWAAMEYGKGVFFLPTTGFGLDEHLILPALALAARPTAEIARLTAELLSEELPKDYIRVARAKGLPEQWIITRHAFRNVVAAVINAMSNSWSYVIGSLVIIERVFAWGGLGEALLDAVTFSQFAGSTFNPALVATLATALALLFLLADLITSSIAQVVDPRLQKAQGGAA